MIQRAEWIGRFPRLLGILSRGRLTHPTWAQAQADADDAAGNPDVQTPAESPDVPPEGRKPDGLTASPSPRDGRYF